MSCDVVCTIQPVLCSVAAPFSLFPDGGTGDKQASPTKWVASDASYVHLAYLLVCAAKLVVPLFNNLQCSVPELAGNIGWAGQRLLRPEPQAEFKKVCEVGSQQSAESSAALKELVGKIHHM